LPSGTLYNTIGYSIAEWIILCSDKNTAKPETYSKSRTERKMNLIDLIQKRKNITFEESDGINLILKYIKIYEGRKFHFKGLKNKYSGLSNEELLKQVQREIESMLILYRYSIKVKQYTDRKGISQCDIRIIGKAGILSRYNMLNIELGIKTENIRPLRDCSNDSCRK